MIVLYFGVGNIGRGFIGVLFYYFGYDVVFVDVNDMMVSFFNEKKEYIVELVEEGYLLEVIGLVSVINSGRQLEELYWLINEVVFIIIVVGLNVLKLIVLFIVEGLR